MKEYLKNVNDEKLKTVFEVRNAYDAGKLTMEEARAILKEKVHTLEPYEVALIEQELKEEIDDECRKEDIQAMLDLFDGILIQANQIYQRHILLLVTILKTKR